MHGLLGLGVEPQKRRNLRHHWLPRWRAMCPASTVSRSRVAVLDIPLARRRPCGNPAESLKAASHLLWSIRLHESSASRGAGASLGSRLRRIPRSHHHPRPRPTAIDGGTLILSGIVYGVEATGRRPLAGATVDISEPGGPGEPLGVRSPMPPAAIRLDRSPPATTGPGHDAGLRRIDDRGGRLPRDVENGRLRARADRTDHRADERDRHRSGGGINRRRSLRDNHGQRISFRQPSTFDAESTAAYVLNPTTIYAITPAHAAATVVVKVTKPSGESATVTGGFRYAAPAVLQFQRHLEGICAGASGLPAEAGRSLPGIPTWTCSSRSRTTR